MQTLADAECSMPKTTKRAAGRHIVSGLRQCLTVQMNEEYSMHATIPCSVWRVDRDTWREDHYSMVLADD